MRTVKCDDCGVAFSAEELSVAEKNLAAHIGVHEGDGWTSEEVAELLKELKESRAFYMKLAETDLTISTPGVLMTIRQLAMSRANEINRILS